jgi:hypothetical protein
MIDPLIAPPSPAITESIDDSRIDLDEREIDKKEKESCMKYLEKSCQCAAQCFVSLTSIT